MSTENQIMQQRKEKLAEWQKLGFGYALKFDRSHTAAQAREAAEKGNLREAKAIMTGPETSVSLCGRIINMREMGKLAFLRIRDVSGDFQVCLAQNALGDEFKTWLKLLDLGDFCGFSGELFLTKHGEPTLLAASVTPLSKSLRPLPEKWHGITDREACYRQRYLDLATNPDTFRRFQIRSDVVRLTRDFFHKLGFMEVETRTLQPQAGGAMAKVFETHHNALDHEFVLRIALELEHKILVAGGIERLFEIGKCFRNEGIDPSHLQEFTMLEWYAAYVDLEQNMAWTEDLIRQLVTETLGTSTITVLDKDEKPVAVDVSKPFPHRRFPDLLKEYAGVDMGKITRGEAEKIAVTKWDLDAKEAKTMSRGSLLDHIYKKSARPHLVQPTFVMDYPSELKPLARPNDDGTASCAQLLIAGWEVTNAYGELVDPQVQRKLLEDQASAKAAGDDEAMEIDEDFLGAMEHGMPPMTGFGMGIDRIVALLTEQANLKDVVLFPLLKPETKPLSAKEAEARYRSKKVIVIADENLNPGVVANAVGQLGISIGGHSKQELFDAKVLHDKDNRTHYTDCLYPMANLAGNQAQMAEFAMLCYEAGIQLFDFTDVMRKAHTDPQMQQGYRAKGTRDLGYLAVGALVPADFAKDFLGTLKLFGAQ